LSDQGSLTKPIIKCIDIFTNMLFTQIYYCPYIISQLRPRCKSILGISPIMLPYLGPSTVRSVKKLYTLSLKKCWNFLRKAILKHHVLSSKMFTFVRVLALISRTLIFFGHGVLVVYSMWVLVRILSTGMLVCVIVSAYSMCSLRVCACWYSMPQSLLCCLPACEESTFVRCDIVSAVCWEQQDLRQ